MCEFCFANKFMTGLVEENLQKHTLRHFWCKYAYLARRQIDPQFTAHLTT